MHLFNRVASMEFALQIILKKMRFELGRLSRVDGDRHSSRAQGRPPDRWRFEGPHGANAVTNIQSWGSQGVVSGNTFEPDAGTPVPLLSTGRTAAGRTCVASGRSAMKFGTEMVIRFGLPDLAVLS
ncbi:hypothetical protein [Burkholderia puraquae]|uniref:hypothetical protein n=1 Tax=Burkholderia puraquae TaxID=1904757 RepID=UPI0013FDC321|nr:hypothetical protein [Burkholderia puraquae]